MTPTDIAMLGQECCSVAAFVLAGCFWIRMRHVEGREQVARTEVRRLKQWGGEGWNRAMEIATKEYRRSLQRSNAASHARQCQIAQQQARKAATTQRLERGE